ncbi:TPA: recombination protein RecR [Patescibacteria group bacterium]|nr:recombination protein RecR [Patescibacteria group bacterium]|tara:strand:+ start:131 stop:730 length:600 start_codon:yes stop_codon:yes gene_type:complete
MFPQPIKKFIDLFSTLPSIGPRQATRLAFHLIGLGKGSTAEFAQAIADLQKLKTCPQCFFIHSQISNECHICNNPQRRKDVVMIVEKETDLMSLEKAKHYQGRYFIIGDLKKNSTFDAEQKLRIGHLKNIIEKNLGGQAEEIILAMNPTTYGDLHASLITQELAGVSKKITRLGRGIPTGGEIEFADEETLGGALINRG